MDVSNELNIQKVESPIKTSQRLRYEAEARAIENRLGNLEAIRAQLGISRRKICQILLVDPSAWNRWTRPKGKAPPHIFRALEWYLILQKKFPEGEYALHSVPARITGLQTEVQLLQKEMRRFEEEKLSSEENLPHRRLARVQLRGYQFLLTLTATLLLELMVWGIWYGFSH